VYREPEEDLSPEQRIFRRVSMRAEILLTADNGVYTGMLVNLSMQGLFATISRRMKAAVGDRVLISIPLTGDFLEDSIKVDGIIVRAEKAGIAVRFQEMDRITFHTLLSIINRHAS